MFYNANGKEAGRQILNGERDQIHLFLCRCGYVLGASRLDDDGKVVLYTNVLGLLPEEPVRD